MDIQDLRIFARVAAVQSLSAVGAEFGLTAGTISKRLQALEQELSARLFDRTTRSVRITPEGRVFLEHIDRVLDDIERARSAIEDSSGRASGKLKIAAPTYLAAKFIAPAVAAFLDAYPDIETQVDLLDRCVNLQEDGYDVVIRSGTLADSALIAKRLAPELRVLVASPSYIERQGMPRSARDIEQHQCLTLNGERQWVLLKSGLEVAVRVQGRMSSNSAELLLVAARAGHGILVAPLASVEDDLAAGRLVRILADHEIAGDGVIHALYSSARHQPPRLRALLDFLAEWARKQALAGRAQVTAPTTAMMRLDETPSVVEIDAASEHRRRPAIRG